AAPTQPDAAADAAAALMASLLAPHIEKLVAFADAAAGALYAARPPLQAFERYGYNLYLAGAAMAAAEAAQLDGDPKRMLIEHVVKYAGTSEETARTFADRIDSSLGRPRYRKLINEGRVALAAQFEHKVEAPHAELPNLIQQWADPNARGSKAVLTFF